MKHLRTAWLWTRDNVILAPAGIAIAAIVLLWLLPEGRWSYTVLIAVAFYLWSKAMAIKHYRKVDEEREKLLTGSEALYGFAAWLMQRKRKVVLSKQNSSQEILKLIERFCRVNGLPPARNGWVQHLKTPNDQHQAPTNGQAKVVKMDPPEDPEETMP